MEALKESVSQAIGREIFKNTQSLIVEVCLKISQPIGRVSTGAWCLTGLPYLCTSKSSGDDARLIPMLKN